MCHLFVTFRTLSANTLIFSPPLSDDWARSVRWLSNDDQGPVSPTLIGLKSVDLSQYLAN